MHQVKKFSEIMKEYVADELLPNADAIGNPQKIKKY